MKQFLEKYFHDILLVVFILVIIATVHILTKTDEKRYNECLHNLPNISYFEEDLEEVFMTTEVEVIKCEQDGKNLYVEAKANNITYKVLYTIEQMDLKSKWKYVRHIVIDGEDKKYDEQLAK